MPEREISAYGYQAMDNMLPVLAPPVGLERLEEDLAEVGARAFIPIVQDLSEAEPGDYVVIARQARKDGVGASAWCSGADDVWFVGGVNDENAREVSFPLDFLKEGTEYEAVIYRDAPDADGVAVSLRKI